MTFFLFWSSTVRCSCHLHACSSSACPLIHCNGSSFARRQGISRAECKRTRKAVASRAAEPSSAAETSAFSWEVGHFRSEINPHVFVLEFAERAQPACFAGSRVLFVDDTGNTHSIYNPQRVLNPGGYWDAMACIPALTTGSAPIAILGLLTRCPAGTQSILSGDGQGAGTIARVLHHYFPAASMIGWELDQAVLMAARSCMGLDSLEASGCLDARVGSALEGPGTVAEPFAAMLVDMFIGNDIIPELAQADTWRHFESNLAPGGRIMANLGCFARAEAALRAMAEVFGPGKVHVKYVGEPQLQNGAILALTGPTVTEKQWQDLPADLALGGQGWRTLRLVDDLS